MSLSRPRLKLRDLLLAVNLAVLWLPLLGLEALRLYDSALIRQTESELIGQAAFVAASYRAALTRRAPRSLDAGENVTTSTPAGVRARPNWIWPKIRYAHRRPIRSRLPRRPIRTPAPSARNCKRCCTTPRS